jgi:hypothetical protein
MPEFDDAALERRLRGVLKEHLGALPLDLTVETLDRRREARARRLGRGRGVTLLAAAALLLVGGALAAGSGLLRQTPSVPPVLEPSVIAVATATPDATVPSASPIPVAGPGGVWIPVGTMGTPRTNNAAVRLLDGRVLALGHDRAVSFSSTELSTAELYDPVTGTWSGTGQMLKPFYSLPSLGLLPDGRVLAADAQGEDRGLGTEVYDPASGTWTATGTIVTRSSCGSGVEECASWEAIAKRASPDAGGTVKLLRDGKVQFVDGRLRSLVVPPGFTGYELLSDGNAILINFDETIRYPVGQCTAAALYDTHTETLTPVALPPCTAGSSSNLAGASFTLLLDGTILVAGGEECSTGRDGVCVPTGAAALYVPAGVPLPPLPAFPSPPPLVFPSPTVTQTPVQTPVPTALPAAVGPVPPNARSWTVTVENRSSEPAALFVANDTLQLVGSATPNVVPAGATMKVTFRFPVDGGLIYVNPRPGEGWLVSDHDIGIPGKIVVGGLGGDAAGWVSP